MGVSKVALIWLEHFSRCCQLILIRFDGKINDMKYVYRLFKPWAKSYPSLNHCIILSHLQYILTPCSINNAGSYMPLEAGHVT